MIVFKVWCRTRWVRCTIDGPFISFDGAEEEWMIHDVRKMADAIVARIHGHWLNNFENWNFSKNLHPNAKEWASRKFRTQMTRKVGGQIWEKVQKRADPDMIRLSGLAYAYDKTLARVDRQDWTKWDNEANRKLQAPLKSLMDPEAMRQKMQDPQFVQQVLNNCDGWRSFAQLARQPTATCENLIQWCFGNLWEQITERINIVPGIPLYALRMASGRGEFDPKQIPLGATQTELKWIIAHYALRYDAERKKTLLAMRAKDIRIEINKAYARFRRMKKSHLPKYLANRKIKSIQGCYSIDFMRWAMDTHQNWMHKR